MTWVGLGVRFNTGATKVNGTGPDYPPTNRPANLLQDSDQSNGVLSEYRLMQAAKAGHHNELA